MNILANMEWIGVAAGCAAFAFFVFGRQPRLSVFNRTLFGLLLVTVLTNSVIDALEQTGAYREYNAIEDYFDMVTLLVWGIFLFSLFHEYSTKKQLDEDRHHVLTLQLALVFTLLLALNVFYGLSSFIKSRNALASVEHYHSPVMVSVVNMRSRSNDAIQEAFAYVISGELAEKEEFENWAQKFDGEAQAFRSLHNLEAALGPDELTGFETVVTLQSELVDEARSMFAEFEATGRVGLTTFEHFEAVVDQFGDDFEKLQQAKTKNYNTSRTNTNRIIEKASFELPILGGLSILTCGSLFALLIWSFRRYSAEQAFARRELAESDNRHRQFLDNLPELIWVADADNRCTFFNKTWLDFTGRTLEQEERHGWSEGIHPDDLAACLQTYDGAFASRESFAMEYRRRRHDGQYRWILDNATPSFEAKDQFTGYIGGCIDITERRRAIESLRQRDQAFRTTITPIAFGDLDGRITEANQAFAELFGFEHVEQLMGRRNTEIHSEPISVAQINAAVIENGRFDGEITSKRLDGTPIELQVSATLFTDTDGHPIGSMATFMDVTARRNVERAFRDSEQHYRTLVESAPEAIVVLDVDESRFVDVNEGAVKIFKLQRHHLLEIGPMELSPEYQPDGSESAKTAMEFVQRALDGGLPSFEWVHIDSEGSEINCEVHLARMASSRRLVRGSITDIGERVELKNALSRRAIEAELLYQAVVMADETDSLDAALQKCVDIVCTMTAWPVGHAYVPCIDGRQQLEPTQFWHFNDEQRFTKFREFTERTLFAMGEGLPGRVWKSGEPAWIENVQEDDNFPRNQLCADLGVRAAFGFPVKIRGETVAILEFFNEKELERNETLLLLVRAVGEQVGRVIERKEAEEAARILHELVAEELDKAKAELILKTRLAAVGQMSAQIAHELRNPLGAVSNAVYYLKRQVPAGQEKWSEYLSLIGGEVATCKQFIGDLLDVTRAKVPSRETTDLADLIDRVLARHKIPSSVDIQVACQPDPFEVFADKNQIIQVIDNLLKNSLDAIGEDRGRIAIHASCQGDCDIITVGDTGKGISSEHRASVFDVLFTAKSAGTGLGLPICRQIIEGHGGTIELMQESLSGTEFQIRLPRQHVYS